LNADDSLIELDLDLDFLASQQQLPYGVHNHNLTLKHLHEFPFSAGRICKQDTP
jgi:hypothetical protein